MGKPFIIAMPTKYNRSIKRTIILLYVLIRLDRGTDSIISPRLGKFFCRMEDFIRFDFDLVNEVNKAI